MDTNSPPRKLAYSIRGASQACDLSRSLIYEAIKLGELQSIKVRSRRLILAEDLLEWITSKRRPT
jgi:excisionase family DNA binding protein